VWGGGDGAEPVPIDNGRTLWLFGDTYIGSGVLGGPLDNRGFVHNSMVVQYGGSCFAYLLRGNPSVGWYSAIADPSDNDYYWPTSGAYDAGTGVLSLTAIHVHQPDKTAPWSWQLVGLDVIRYRMTDMAVLGTERLFTYGPADVAQFGTNLLVEGSFVYHYGCAQSGPTHCYVARTDLGLHGASLRYLGAGGWMVGMQNAQPIALTDPVGTQLHVTAMADGYIASNQIPLLGTETWGWWGPTATGPFTPIGKLWDTSVPPVGPLPGNWYSYGGRIINTSAGPIGVFSVNTADDEAARVAGVYGPRFLGVGDHVLDRRPFGAVESVWGGAPGSGTVQVRGWVLEPDTDATVTVHLTIDGEPGPTVGADAPRGHLDYWKPSAGLHHGLEVTLPVGPGVHEVCAVGVNQGLGNGDRLIGCARGGAAGPASGFVPMSPTRILDSRNGTGGYTTPWGPGQTRTLHVAGTAGVPTDATAVVLNLTVTDPTAPGFVSVGPSGGVPPAASAINFVAGQTIANLVTVQLGADGRIDLTNLTGHTNLVADIVGSYVDPLTATEDGDTFVPLAPTRILDSRNGTGGYTTPWGPGQTRTLHVAGTAGVPTDATAVVLNLTVTDPTAPGWVRANPTGTPPPLASNINFVAGQTIANLVTVQLGADGRIDLTNLTGHTNLVADIVGYFAPS
jgi:hypothetical protein